MYPFGVAIGPKQSDGSWPVYAGSATGVYAIAAPGSTGNSAGAAASLVRTIFGGTLTARALWSVEEANVVTPLSLSPDGSTLYYGEADEHIYAVDTNNGNIKWKYQTGSALSAAPTVSADGKTVFVGSSVGTFHAINSTSGNSTWICAALGPIQSAASLSTDGKTVYFGSSDTYLYAVASQNNSCGNSVSHTQPCRDAPAPNHSIKPGCGNWWLRPNEALLFSSPMVDDAHNRIVVTTDNTNGVGGVYGVPMTGKGIITAIFNGSSAINTPAVKVSDDMVVFGSEDSKVYAVTTSDNKVAWTYATEQPLSAAPISNGEIVVLAGRSGELTVLHAATGTVGWSGQVGSSLSSSAAVDGDGRLVVATGDGVIAGYMDASVSLSTDWSIVFGAIVLLGLFEGIVGYRYFPLTVAIIGAGLLAPAGYIVGAYVQVINANQWYHFGVTVGAGLIGAILFATILRKIGAFALGCGFGAILAVDLGATIPVVPQLQIGAHIDASQMALPLGIVGGGALVFGILACAMPKLISILSTSIFGATSLVNGIAYYAGITDTMILGIGYAALTFIFLCIQSCCTGKEDYHLTESQRKTFDDDSDEEAYRRRLVDDPERGRRGDFDPNFEPIVADGGGSGGTASSRLYSSRAGRDYGSGKRAAPPIDDDGTGRTFTATFNKGPLGLRFAPGGGRIPAYVMGVADGQGRESGVQEGDILVAIAGAEVNAFADFDGIMGELSTARRPVTLTFRSRSRAPPKPAGEIQI